MGEEQKEFTLVIRGGGANGEDVSDDKGWSFSFFGGDRELMALSAAASTVRRSSVLPRLTTIVQGKIMQVGGKTPGIRVETGKGTVVVGMSEEEIRKENLVYQERNIEVSYRYDPETGEESNFQFIRFIDTPEYDRDSMLALIAQETEAWRDVDNVTEWVEAQRGKELLKTQLSQI